jgi:hypothetical protein
VNLIKNEVMEANEAPEKIYIVNDDLNIKREWYKTKQVGFETIEYTRTDAIIKKAFEFFDEHLCEYINVKNANCDTFINIDSDKFKEEFKKTI